MMRSGEPCDWKRSRTVRRGVFGKVPLRQLATRLPYTFYCNCYLSREYTNGIPFDLLESMGHGRHIARAFRLTWYVLSAKNTTMNPNDVMYPTMPCSRRLSYGRVKYQLVIKSKVKVNIGIALPDLYLSGMRLWGTDYCLLVVSSRYPKTETNPVRLCG